MWVKVIQDVNKPMWVRDPLIYGKRWRLKYDEDGCVYLLLITRITLLQQLMDVWHDVKPKKVSWRIEFDSTPYTGTTVDSFGKLRACCTVRVKVKKEEFDLTRKDYSVEYKGSAFEYQPE